MSTNTNRVRDWAVEAAEAAMLLMESPAIDDAGKVVTDSTELMWLIAGRIREAYAAEQPAAQEAVGYIEMSVGGLFIAALYDRALNLAAGTELYTRPAEPAAVPDRPFVDVKKLRRALSQLGIAAPESNEQLSASASNWIDDVLDAVLAAREGQSNG